MSKRRTYYVYIMSSLSRTLYTGVTNNLERHVAEHKARRPGSFTARYNVTKLVYSEEFDDISQAIGRQSEIKQMARSTKIGLIESTNPEWRDFERQMSWQNPGFLARGSHTRGNDKMGRSACKRIYRTRN
jgi:putative endonuclease